MSDTQSRSSLVPHPDDSQVNLDNRRMKIYRGHHEGVVNRKGRESKQILWEVNRTKKAQESAEGGGWEGGNTEPIWGMVSLSIKTP